MAKQGAPTKYTKKYIELVDKYLKECVDHEIERVKSYSKSGESFEHKLHVKMPTIEGYARFAKIHKDTAYEWAKKYQNFSDALDKIREEQHQRLINNGLSGDYSPVIAKLMLSNNHGYKEKSDVTSDGKSIVLEWSK